MWANIAGKDEGETAEAERDRTGSRWSGNAEERPASERVAANIAASSGAGQASSRGMREGTPRLMAERQCQGECTTTRT